MRGAGLIPGDTDERWADVDRRAPWVLPGGGTIARRSRAEEGQYREHAAVMVS